MAEDSAAPVVARGSARESAHQYNAQTKESASHGDSMQPGVTMSAVHTKARNAILYSKIHMACAVRSMRSSSRVANPCAYAVVVTVEAGKPSRENEEEAT